MQSPQITPRILATTDFSSESETAFFHALAAAVKRQARLTLLHTGPEERDSIPWDQFPGVRDTLTTWRLLPADSPRSAVAETLNVGVAKMTMRDSDPRQGITDYLRRHPTDLLVMATEGRSGLARVFHPSVAERVSYLTRSHTLMLPKNGRTFIDRATGESQLRRVLCALNPVLDPNPALAFLGQWLPALAGRQHPVDVTFLETRPDEGWPQPLFPQINGIRWHTETRTGEPLETLIDAARREPPDMVVISTPRPARMLKRMRGSRVDRILKELRIPVLSVAQR
jgi:nucleotide-binding universal stress UspA family protein